jgi:hypothetical protein
MQTQFEKNKNKNRNEISLMSIRDWTKVEDTTHRNIFTLKQEITTEHTISNIIFFFLSIIFPRTKQIVTEREKTKNKKRKKKKM